MMVRGVPASPGYAVGNAFVLKEPELTIKTEKVAAAAIAEEWNAFLDALQHVKADLESTMEEMAKRLGESESAIFASHIMILEDPLLHEEIGKEIKEDGKNAAWAVQEVFHRHADLFAALDDEYMKERAADFRDLGKRLVKQLLGIRDSVLDAIVEPVILVAHDLTPSETARLNTELIRGIVTEIGGPTSHSAILARNLQIPAVVGVPNLLSHIATGQCIALDGVTGELHLSVTDEQRQKFEILQSEYRARLQSLRQSAQQPAMTKDGRRVEVAANIGKPADVQAVLENGGEAIGLFRSEFLFIDRDRVPTEEEQFHAYAEVAKAMGGRPVIIRTLDIGGDKQLPYLPLEPELNPFLGFRAIRLCLAEKELFLSQLRAILRASSYGKLRVMFPMIATESELLQALALWEEAKASLRRENQPFDEAMEVGVMIEVPSAALISDVLARHVDFFSIGSNDLIQYTFAADRMNQKVNYLYDPGHLSILRLIQLVVDNAHRQGKWVGVCGEMAGDPQFAKYLVGIGVDELSMTATFIPRMKYELAQISYQEQKEAIRSTLVARS